MALKAVVFDIDGTLYRSEEYEKHLSEAIELVLAEMLKVSPAEAGSRLLEKKRVVKTVSRSVELLGLNRHEFYRRLVKRVEVDKFICPRPEIAEMLRRLRGMGLKVVLHTNSGRPLAEKVLQTLKVDGTCFDFLLTSDEAAPKPSPQGYLSIVERLGLEPRDILYVGDRLEVEVSPAKTLGMRTALVGGPKHVEKVDLHLSSVEEVERAVTEMVREKWDE